MAGYTVLRGHLPCRSLRGYLHLQLQLGLCPSLSYQVLFCVLRLCQAVYVHLGQACLPRELTISYSCNIPLTLVATSSGSLIHLTLLVQPPQDGLDQCSHDISFQPTCQELYIFHVGVLLAAHRLIVLFSPLWPFLAFNRSVPRIYFLCLGVITVDSHVCVCVLQVCAAYFCNNLRSMSSCKNNTKFPWPIHPASVWYNCSSLSKPVMDTGQTLVTKQHGLLHTFVDVWLSEILSHIQISLTAHMSRVTWRVRWVVCNHLLSSVPALGKPTLLYIPTTLSSQELHGDPTRQSLSIMTLLQVMEARRSWRMGGTHCTLHTTVCPAPQGRTSGWTPA